MSNVNENSMNNQVEDMGIGNCSPEAPTTLARIEQDTIGIVTTRNHYTLFYSLDEIIQLNFELSNLIPILREKLKKEKQAQIENLERELKLLG